MFGLDALLSMPEGKDLRQLSFHLVVYGFYFKLKKC